MEAQRTVLSDSLERGCADLRAAALREQRTGRWLIAAAVAVAGCVCAVLVPVAVSPLPSATAVALAVVAYPVLEEFVFRGGVQDGLLRVLKGRPDAAIMAAGLAFAAAHWPVHGAMVAVLMVPPGLSLGIIAYGAGHWGWSAFVHCLWNGLFLWSHGAIGAGV